VRYARKTLGHLALHYRTKEEGPAAAKLLDLLGFARVPSPKGYPFYHYVVTERRPTMATVFFSSWNSRRR